MSGQPTLGATPVGGVVAYFGTLDQLPSDWLLCDGSKFDPVVFPGLFGALGATTTPDLQGYFLRGLDPSGKIDIGGAERTVGSVEGADIGPHTHDYSAFAFSGDVGYNGGSNALGTAAAVTAAGSGKETRPINVAVYYVIYGGEAAAPQA